MSKFSSVLLCLILSQSALAEGLRWSLPCKADSSSRPIPAHVDRYKMTKIAFVNPKPVPGKKWDYRYVLEVYFKSQPSKAYEYRFVSAGSGDEDYNEYNLDAKSKKLRSINVSAAYIQNSFKWVNLVDGEGYGFVNCR